GLIGNFVAFDDSCACRFREQRAELRRARLRGMRLNIPIRFVERLPEAIQVRRICPLQSRGFVSRWVLRECCQSGNKDRRSQDLFSHGLTAESYPLTIKQGNADNRRNGENNRYRYAARGAQRD